MRGSDATWVQAIRGPITLITLGALFVLNNFTNYGFERTWPVLLIVFGLLSLLKRSVEPPPAPPAFPPPTYSYAPPPPSGTYSGSSYSESGPSKGGFGTSAPPRSPETGQENPPAGENV